MTLSDLEVRILGALLEKERTTPDAYPLSTNALVLACNQRSNRDPVSDYGAREVGDALRALQDRGLTRTSHAPGERVPKHHHRLDEAWDLSAREFALLAVLLLRGPQTPGELRSRTERYVQFPDAAAVEASLARLAAHQPSLARNQGRGPGQSQDRWTHTLGADPERLKPRVRTAEGVRPVEGASARPDGAADERPERSGELAALRREVAELRARLERLEQRLAGEPGEGDPRPDDAGF